MSRAAASTLAEVHTVRGDIDSESLELEKLLAFICRESPRFRYLLAYVLRDCQTLSLVLYCDGLTPGNPMAHDNRRKSCIFYCSFLEFGSEWLAHEEVWLTIATQRTSSIKKQPGGLSSVTRNILRSLFIEQKVGSGIVVAAEHGERRVCVALGAVLADEEALNGMWHIKGAGGITPCGIMCSVVCRPSRADREAGIRSLAERSELIQDISCSDVKRCGLRSDADVWSLADDVAAAHGTPNLDELEQSTGIKYHPNALLFDRELRAHVKPSTVNRGDPMHIIFSNGILGFEIMLLLSACKQHYGVYFEQLRDDLQAWSFPRLRGSSPADCFNEHRENSSGDFLKCGASELLGSNSPPRFSN